MSSVRASPHAQDYGAFNMGDMVTRENQYPDRFGQRPNIGDDGQAFGVEADPALAAMQQAAGSVKQAAAQLDTMHRARKAVARNAARDAAYHQAMQAARESLNNAARVARLPVGNTTRPYELRTATASLGRASDALRALVLHPTGRGA